MQRHSIGLADQQQNGSAEGREGSKVRERHLAGSATVSDYPSPLSDCLQGRDTEGRPYMSTNASMPLGLGGRLFCDGIGKVGGNDGVAINIVPGTRGHREYRAAHASRIFMW